MRALIFLAALLAAPAAQAQSLDDLAFMAGCWKTSPLAAENGAEVHEVWSGAYGPAMFGYSFTRGDGEVQNWEQMRIEMADGWPVFVAMPNGGAPVRFRMVEPGAPVRDIVQFANEENEFPKLIQYNLEGDMLIASLFGEDASSEVRFDYARVECAAR